jgi:hypothetical protein
LMGATYDLAIVCHFACGGLASANA